MSCSDSCDAKPFMIGFLRLSALNSVSCLTMYSGCCPCRIGLAALPREPSLVWQATHTPFDVASPFARSGLAAAGACAASWAVAVTVNKASARANGSKAADFISGGVFIGCKTRRFYNDRFGRPHDGAKREDRARLGAHRALPHHGEPVAAAAAHRAARDRVRR